MQYSHVVDNRWEQSAFKHNPVYEDKHAPITTLPIIPTLEKQSPVEKEQKNNETNSIKINKPQGHYNHTTNSTLAPKMNMAQIVSAIATTVIASTGFIAALIAILKYKQK